MSTLDALKDFDDFFKLLSMAEYHRRQTGDYHRLREADAYCVARMALRTIEPLDSSHITRELLLEAVYRRLAAADLSKRMGRHYLCTLETAALYVNYLTGKITDKRYERTLLAYIGTPAVREQLRRRHIY
jgi:hypothetical protein